MISSMSKKINCGPENQKQFDHMHLLCIIIDGLPLVRALGKRLMHIIIVYTVLVYPIIYHDVYVLLGWCVKDGQPCVLFHCEEVPWRPDKDISSPLLPPHQLAQSQDRESV